jgi:hypothetical protein
VGGIFAMNEQQLTSQYQFFAREVAALTNDILTIIRNNQPITPQMRQELVKRYRKVQSLSGFLKVAITDLP